MGGKPFVIGSMGWNFGRFYIGPHVNVGYEWNGSSVLGGSLLGVSERLPRRLEYAVGTEVGLFKRATVTLDFLGERLFNAEHDYAFAPNPPLILGLEGPGGAATGITSIDVTNSSVNLKDGSVGVKVNPWHTLLLTGNLTYRLNRSGLRARVVPLVGISYTF